MESIYDFGGQMEIDSIPIEHPLIETQKYTCFACPEQYEGILKDGRWFYFRYRFGRARLDVGNTGSGGVDREASAWMQIGDELQGVFDSHKQRDQVFTQLMQQIEGAHGD